MTFPSRQQACPSCGRRWDRDAAYCGACGAPLAGTGPNDEVVTPPGRAPSRLRWWGVVATVVALGVAVGVLPGIGPRGPDGGVDTTTIELPSEIPTATSTPAGSVPVRCTQDQVIVDCLAWDVDTGGTISLGPRLPGGQVLVDQRPEALTVRDASTGAVRWRREDLGRASPLQVTGEVLLVRSGPTSVTAFDLDDGTERWRATDVRSVGSLPELPGAAVLGRVGEDEVDGLVALDPDSGEVIWEWSTPWDAPIASAVRAVAPHELLVTGGGRLARVDGATGATRWDVETLPGGYLQAQPPDHVSVQQLTEGDDPRLWVHDVATGARVLEMPAARVATHLVAGDRLVVHAPAEGVVRAHDLATGEQRWSLVLEGGPGALGFPATAAAPRDALVVLERGQRRVTRLDPSTGDPLWSFRLRPSTSPPRDGGTFLGTPAIVDDHVVVEDTSSIVTVLDLATGEERVRVAGAPDLDVRSLDPLTLVQDTRWVAVAVPPRPERARQ